MACLVIMPILILMAAGGILAVMALVREHVALREVLGPDRCVKCRYVVDAATRARATCPECGVDFRRVGVSTARMRMEAIDRRWGAFAAAVCVGILTGVVAGVMMALNAEGYGGGGGVSGLLVFLLVGVVVGGIGASWVSGRRSRVRERLKEQQAERSSEGTAAGKTRGGAQL